MPTWQRLNDVLTAALLGLWFDACDDLLMGKFHNDKDKLLQTCTSS